MNCKPILAAGLLLGGLLATASTDAQAQTADRRTALSANVGLLQYSGNMGTDFWDLGRTDFRVGGGGGITRYMSPSFDLGLYGYYETYRFVADADKFKNAAFEARSGFVDFGIKLKLNNGKILKENARVQPYLMAGGGAFLANSKGNVGQVNFFNQIRRLDAFGAAGLRFRMTDAVYLDLQTSQHYPFTDRVDNLEAPSDKLYDRFLLHTLGLTVALPGAKDTDEDGVKDKLDKCPNRAGPASNQGCPEIKAETKKRLSEATKFIQFEFNKAVLKTSSYPTLEQLAAVMAEYPDYTMGISAHADNKGEDNYNLRLSDDRAASARTYMLSKGVPADRIVSHGYGETKPIGDNKTDAGRALNRRVEFDLYLTGDPNASEVKYGPAPTIAPEPVKAAPVKKAPAKKAPVKRRAPAKRK